MSIKCISITVLLVFAALFSLAEDMQFKHLNINNGLSSNQVKAIYKDSNGFVWVGTVNGLNRFDGYEVKVFRKVTNDPFSLPDNYINQIFEDNNGNLWIDTGNGLTVFDRKKEKFGSFHPLFEKHPDLFADGFVNVLTDINNNLWIIKPNKGVFKYDATNDTVIHLRPGHELLPHTINDARFDSKGNLWLLNKGLAIEIIDPSVNRVFRQYTSALASIPKSTNEYRFFLDNDHHPWIYIINEERGVFHFNTSDLKINQYSSRSSVLKLSHDNISCITVNPDGHLLIGTDHGGLNVIDKKTGRQRVFEFEQGEKNSLSQNSITSILRDNENMIWIGTYKKGVNYYHPELFKFTAYTNNPNRRNWLSTEDVNTFAEDGKGNLWIGTNGGGLLYFDRKANSFKTYRHEQGNPWSLSSDVIVDLCIDHKGGLWIGTYMGGLNYFDGKRFTRYQHQPNNPHSLPSTHVWAVHEDGDQQLWIGTLGGGIAVFERNTGHFNQYSPYGNAAVNSNYIMSIAEDQNRNIWFATANGIDFYDKSTGRFTQFLRDENAANTFSSNSTLDVYCDSRGWVWIANREGLNLFRPETKATSLFGHEIELINSTVVTIIEDNAGNMWLGTPHGLTNLMIDIEDDGELIFSAKSYDEKDGLHGKEFNEHAALKTRKGELVFGGADGFSIFDPAGLSNSMFNPKMVFTDLKIQNRRIDVGQEVANRVILPYSLNDAKAFTLKHFEKSFSVGFSAINYLSPEKMLFHYRLEGFNEAWTTLGPGNREISYTNLHPGEYLLRVYASDMENRMKSEEMQLVITILPPFWQTKWAYSLYMVGILLLVFFIIQVFLRRERNKFLAQQERLESAKVHEMDMLKLKFFTNISHEFRTPLTLIISPLDRIIKTTTDTTNQNQLKLVQRNARRLLSLVNQLLDFRRLEVKGLSLDVREGELVSFCRETTESFSDLSDSRNIKLTFTSNVESLNASFDYDKIEKIIFNLLSNAFKFTPENGSVSVSLLCETINNDLHQVKLEVRDTGIGIPKEKHEVIFERFVQSIPEGVSVNKGSGIGLSLTREFVQMHEGSINVESVPGVGSCFTVILPLKSNFRLQQPDSETVSVQLGGQQPVISIESEEASTESKRWKLLIVEDNPDIRFYLKDNLKDEYEIIEASNGDQAWDIVPVQLPDMVVSDIMMPGMDGLELCRTIKTDKRTSHIPVILLTARTTDQHRYEGLENGADDYITKPFNFELLALRIKKLIELRQTWRSRYQKNFEIQPAEISITSLDEKFLSKVKKITEENMQEPDFSVEKLSSEVGISRAHLYNKLLSLTGKTPIEYIRIMRIRRSAQLLEKSQLTVMEVAYKVGFNDPRYFTKHFKAEYNLTPTQYIKKHSKA